MDGWHHVFASDHPERGELELSQLSLGVRHYKCIPLVLRLFEIPAVEGPRMSFTALFEEMDNTTHGLLYGHVTDARLVSAQDTLFVFELLPPPAFGFASVEMGELSADDMNRLRLPVLANRVSAMLRTDLPGMESLVVPLVLVRDGWLKSHCDWP